MAGRSLFCYWAVGWGECDGAGEADRDIAAGGKLFGTPGRENCPGKGPGTIAKVDTYDLMEVPLLRAIARPGFQLLARGEPPAWLTLLAASGSLRRQPPVVNR